MNTKLCLEPSQSMCKISLQVSKRLSFFGKGDYDDSTLALQQSGRASMLLG